MKLALLLVSLAALLALSTAAPFEKNEDSKQHLSTPSPQQHHNMKKRGFIESLLGLEGGAQEARKEDILQPAQRNHRYSTQRHKEQVDQENDNLFEWHRRVRQHQRHKAQGSLMLLYHDGRDQADMEHQLNDDPTQQHRNNRVQHNQERSHYSQHDEEPVEYYRDEILELLRRVKQRLAHQAQENRTQLHHDRYDYKTGKHQQKDISKEPHQNNRAQQNQGQLNRGQCVKNSVEYKRGDFFNHAEVV